METMPKAIKSGRANGQQSEFLVEYMVSHSEFANGKLMGPQGAIKATQHWTNLSNCLNELGPEKTMEQWKKLTDASCTANVISSNKSSNWVEEPKSHHTLHRMYPRKM